MTQITAIILTINKPSHLRRQLLYYANKPVHLILADGSDSDWGSGYQGSIGEMSWEYFRIAGTKTYLKRQAEASRRIKTDFVFLVDHEECILWSGVKQAIDFLNTNREFACAGGRADTAQLSRKRLCLIPHYNNKNNFELTEDDALERFKHGFQVKRGRDLTYQIKRAADFKVFAETMENLSLEGKSRYIPEILQFGYISLIGKYKSQEYPFWIRNGGSTVPMHGDPDRPTLADVEQMGDLIFRAFEKQNQMFGSISENLNAEKLINIMKVILRPKININYLKVNNDSKSQILKKFKKALWKKILIFSQVFFDFFPSVYQVLRPSGYQTFTKFALKYSRGSPEVIKDISLIERIWKEFPTGVSEKEFQNYQFFKITNLKTKSF